MWAKFSRPMPSRSDWDRWRARSVWTETIWVSEQSGDCLRFGGGRLYLNATRMQGQRVQVLRTVVAFDGGGHVDANTEVGEG